MSTPDMTGQLLLPLPDAGLDAKLARRITPGWQAQAACNENYPDLFFPEPGDDSAVETTSIALDTCNGCRVRSSCRAAALLGDEQGVWGGTTADDRDQLRDALASGTSVDSVLLARVRARGQESAA